MARHYSPKAFMIEAPNRLLKEYYERHGLNDDIPWQHLSEKDMEIVFRAYENAAEQARRQIDNDFRSIQNLASEGGIKTLIDVGRSQFHGVDFMSVFDDAEGHIERAFIAFLYHLDAFKEACCYNYADTLGHFRKRKHLPKIEKQPDDDSRARLANSISEYYKSKEGRGHGCDVEYYKRDMRHYWFAHPEDYTQYQLLFLMRSIA